MAIFSDQLRQVLRRLGRAPLFTAVTLFTLAIAIGANTVIGRFGGLDEIRRS